MFSYWLSNSDIIQVSLSGKPAISFPLGLGYDMFYAICEYYGLGFVDCVGFLDCGRQHKRLINAELSVHYVIQIGK